MIVITGNIPRRCRIDLNTPAELAIRAAVLAVEKMAADTRLTDAVCLLAKALDKVADYVDDCGVLPQESDAKNPASG